MKYILFDAFKVPFRISRRVINHELLEPVSHCLTITQLLASYSFLDEEYFSHVFYIVSFSPPFSTILTYSPSNLQTSAPHISSTRDLVTVRRTATAR